MKKLWIYFLLAVIIQAQNNNEEEFKFYPDYKGKLQTRVTDIVNSFDSPYDSKQMLLLINKLKNIAGIFEKNEFIKSPKGVDIKIYLTPQVFESIDGRMNIAADILIYALAYVSSGDSKPQPHAETSYSLIIRINNILELFGKPVSGFVYLEPAKAWNFNGYNNYNNGDDYLTVISNIKRPLYFPATQNEYFDCLLKQDEEDSKKRADELNKPESNISARQEFDDGKAQRKKDFEEAYKVLLKADKNAAEELKKSYEQVEKEMDELMKANGEKKDLIEKEASYASERRLKIVEAMTNISPEERRKPAYYLFQAEEENITGLVPGDAEEASAMIRINPNFFDLYKNHSEIQSLTITGNGFIPYNYSEGREGFKLELWTLAEICKNENLWKQLISLISK